MSCAAGIARVFRAIPNLTIRYNANFVCWATGEAGVRANTFHHSPRRVYYAASRGWRSVSAVCLGRSATFGLAVSKSSVPLRCRRAKHPCRTRGKIPGQIPNLFARGYAMRQDGLRRLIPSYRLLPRYQRTTLAHANDHSRRKSRRNR